MASPVLIRMLSIVPLSFVLPVMLAEITLVQLNTVPATSDVGVKFSCAPLQIVSVSGRFVKFGVGLTVTVVTVTAEVHPLPVAVNVYVTTTGAVAVLVNVSVIVPVAPSTVRAL